MSTRSDHTGELPRCLLCRQPLLDSAPRYRRAEGSLHVECDQRRASAGLPTGSDRRYRQFVEVEAIVWDDTEERARIETT